MPETLTVEERVRNLEQEVAQLKLQLDQLSKPKENWLEQISGSMKDYPEFGEVIKYGEEMRKADRPPDES